ncbi:hypothetical protein FIBSPDRAFT_856163 [Athelia psychrophila]|uniref:Uncharacterized protein n=1 Tax=Athelia psychrophila TaxID=1759441 RepID=A0A166NMV0_9AGAM|nr:hypothetical protein FIBSPDRAFT_856163 [Fibularhizoctonia sp. CBS 109695]
MWEVAGMLRGTLPCRGSFISVLDARGCEQVTALELELTAPTGCGWRSATGI